MDLSMARLLLLYPQLIEEAHGTLEEGEVQAPSVTCNLASYPTSLSRLKKGGNTNPDTSREKLRYCVKAAS